eukprot:Rhum_TRINITY_DN15374_c4_g1::Rhum_TRINITY_DN15374_c4_g1_i1::g.153809::m.153809
MSLHGDPVNSSSDLDLSIKVSQIRYYSGHAPSDSNGVALRVDFSGDGDGAGKVSRVLRDRIENQWVATSFTSDMKTVRLQVWRQEQLVGECGVQFSRQCHKLGQKVVRLVGSKADHSAEHGKYIGELVVEWRCLAFDSSSNSSAERISPILSPTSFANTSFNNHPHLSLSDASPLSTLLSSPAVETTIQAMAFLGAFVSLLSVTVFHDPVMFGVGVTLFITAFLKHAQSMALSLIRDASGGDGSSPPSPSSQYRTVHAASMRIPRMEHLH